jgi:hypothetical protein
MRADIVPGGVFPEYELTDHTRTRRKLSELQGRSDGLDPPDASSFDGPEGVLSALHDPTLRVRPQHREIRDLREG